MAWPQVSVPLISRPVARYRKGGTTPMWSLASISMSVLFIVVVVYFCHLLSFLLHISSLELGCGYKFSLCMYKYVESYGKFVF